MPKKKSGPLRSSERCQQRGGKGNVSENEERKEYVTFSRH